jgi:hypothetical protein
VEAAGAEHGDRRPHGIDHLREQQRRGHGAGVAAALTALGDDGVDAHLQHLLGVAARTDSAAPFRTRMVGSVFVACRSIPLIRVCAVNGTNVACSSCISRARKPNFSFARTTIERPSGVSSASELSCADAAKSLSATPGAE